MRLLWARIAISSPHHGRNCRAGGGRLIWGFCDVLGVWDKFSALLVLTDISGGVWRYNRYRQK